MNNKKVNTIFVLSTKMFLALVTVICFIQSFQRQIKEKQSVYNNKGKKCMSGFSYFFLKAFEKYWWIYRPFDSSLSTQLLPGTDADLTPPHTECDDSHSPPGLDFSLNPEKPASKPLCLLNLFDTTVEKSLCIENRRLSLHHHFQLAHYVKISMHGHNWNVSCFLPCKSYMVYHGRRTPYFKYSVDKDLKMEDSYSAPLMVKWEDFCFSVCLHFLPFFFFLFHSGPSDNICKHKYQLFTQSGDSWSVTGAVKVHVWSWCVDHLGLWKMSRWKDIFLHNTQHLAI